MFILLQYAGMVRVYNCLIPFSVVLADDPVDFSTAPSKKAWVQGVTCVKEKDFKRMVVALIFKHKAAAPRSAQSTGSSEPRPGTPPFHIVLSVPNQRHVAIVVIVIESEVQFLQVTLLWKGTNNLPRFFITTQQQRLTHRSLNHLFQIVVVG